MTMKLFEITNGYIGNSYVRMLVIAESEESALNMARPIFKEQAQGRVGPKYDDSYFENLSAEILCDNVLSPWIGKIDD